MTHQYHYPFAVAKIEGGSTGILKSEVSSAARKALINGGTGYICCQCNAAWPGCPCPETEDESLAASEKFLSQHPSVIRDRESQAAFIAQGGDSHSIQAWRKWEMKR